MDILTWVESLLTDYGAVNVIIMFLVILFTNLIKKPIVNKAEEFVAKAKQLLNIDVDKSVITSNIIYIPIGISLILYTMWNIIYAGFDFSQIVWSSVISDAFVYGMLSISIFEVFKSKIKSYTSKNTYKDAKEQLAALESAAKNNTETESTVNTEVTEESVKNTEDSNQNESEILE